jgi:hypothetical protein
MNAIRTESPQLNVKDGLPSNCAAAQTKGLPGYFREYARQRPEVVALLCVGLGFVVGWKLNRW